MSFERFAPELKETGKYDGICVGKNFMNISMESWKRAKASIGFWAVIHYDKKEKAIKFVKSETGKGAHLAYQFGCKISTVMPQGRYYFKEGTDIYMIFTKEVPL